jgi:hypothetical protein
LGNAYFDLANARDLAHLKLSAGAFQKAEALLTGIDNRVEKMKLDYSYGNTLFHLSDAKDMRMLEEARRRYASALAMAQTNMPAGVESARSALANADRVIALLKQADALSQTAAVLRKQPAARHAGAAAAVAPEPAPDWATLFGQLMGEYQESVASGKVSETKDQALEPLLAELGSIVQSNPVDLADMTVRRGDVADLATRLLPLLAETSHGDSPLPADSRADWVWKRFSGLKLYVAQELKRPHMGSEEWSIGIAIYKRCGYADTYLHQPGRDDDNVRSYETDVLRQLALDVRGFSMRNHLALVSPISPSSPPPQNPSGVFFSGSRELRSALGKVCTQQKLTLLGETDPKDLAAARREQLWACHAAVFDFTGYRRPDSDQPVDVAVAGPLAAVAYGLGIALTLGRPVVVLSNEGQDLPFNVDIEPIRLKRGAHKRRQLTEALDRAIYGLQRSGAESSIAATHAYANRRFAGSQPVLVAQSLKLIDADVANDPVRFRRFLEPVLGSIGTDAPQVVFPAWPVNYPDPVTRRCFHVTAFGPAWAEDTMTIVSAACKAVHPSTEYIRGDQVLAPDVVRSIWDNLCQASHVVVDLTGLNANVALELGIAHTLGRNVLLVSQDSGAETHFPAIAKMRIHRYSVASQSGRKSLRDAVTSFLRVS